MYNKIFYQQYDKKYSVSHTQKYERTESNQGGKQH